MNKNIFFRTANGVLPMVSAMQAAGENSCRRTNITESRTKFPHVCIPTQALSLLLFVFLILSVQPAFSAGLTEDFKLKKVGSHCEPELDEWVAIPGRDMKAGSFVILYNKASDSTEEARISGVLINNEAVYYPGGDYWTTEMNFGFYKDYLVMDAWGSGASHNRRMYLYRLGEKNVELLDTIGQAYINNAATLDFMSVSKSEFRSSGWGTNGLIEVADIDHDNRPELKLKIYWGYIFNIYLEIKDGRLSVDFSPELYKPLFEDVKRNNPMRKTAAYYIYGFLSGELKLDRIKEMISANKLNKERHAKVVPLLESADKWDHAFHDNEKFELLRYELKEAVCDE